MTKPPPGAKVMLPPSMTNAHLYIWLKQRSPQHDGKMLLEAALSKADDPALYELDRVEGKPPPVVLRRTRGLLDWRAGYPLWLFVTYNFDLITDVWNGAVGAEEIKARLRPNPDGTDFYLRSYQP